MHVPAAVATYVRFRFDDLGTMRALPASVGHRLSLKRVRVLFQHKGAWQSHDKKRSPKYPPDDEVMPLARSNRSGDQADQDR